MTLTEARMRRLEADAGAYVDRHDRGLSFDELAQYRGRMVEFARDIFGIELSPQQAGAVECLDTERQVLIAGANGTGKDTLAAVRTLYEVYVLGALALLSGPSDRQVREVLMRREIGRLWRMSEGKLPGERFEMAIRIPGREEGGLLAFTASDPEKFVGHHSASGRVFIALTEGQGIEPEIYEAAQRCQPSLLLVVCNPTTPDCAAYNMAHAVTWKAIKWPATEHVNVKAGREIIRGAVTRGWVEAMRAEHGTESRFWHHAVLAEWPEESEEALVQRAWLDAAEERWRRSRSTPAVLSGGFDRTLALGVDPARLGPDRTVVCVRAGGHVVEFLAWRELDTMQTAERVESEVRRLNAGVGCVESVHVDSIGLGGGVLDRLAQLLPDIEAWVLAGREARRVTPTAESFDAGRQAGLPKRFTNLRAQGYWKLRELLEQGWLALPPNAQLREELLATRVKFMPDNRTQIEPKEAIKARIGRSPDYADALVISLAPLLESVSAYEFWIQ